MISTELLWIGVFNVFVLAMLALDLLVFNRKSHEVSIKESLLWSAVWISMAMLFNAGIFIFWHQFFPESSYSNKEAALAFFAGYLIEKSLSVDNLFVFLLIFSYFKVNAIYQHKVLFWGIIGALVMRAILIFFGVVLITTFHWVIYVFGAFLIYTGIKMSIHKEDAEIHPDKNIVVKFFKSFIKISPQYYDDKFFVKIDGKRYGTILFVVLIVVETTDLVFAVDSIPAILAITTDPFLVYTSNVFAILGLRALYFALAGIMNLFHYLRLGLALVLIFVGAKMVFADIYKIPIGIALGVVAAILIISIVASVLRPQSKKE
ncbi:MAG: TerC family protein [Ignavibacteriales bacterium]|nr:TerC family protein [Ignavibacteriales bacterium]